MAKKKRKVSVLRDLIEDLVDIQQKTSIYNNAVEQILKMVNKRYGKLVNVEIDDEKITKELLTNDQRFLDVINSMIAVEEKMSAEGKRKYAFVYAQYERMVDRTTSSMTKNMSSYTMNFCVRRTMSQNTILIKKIIDQMNTIATREESGLK